jgi:tRNA G18 (ribose-2'-O)-methylase SpoU
MAAWFGERGIPIVGVDNLPGALALEATTLPESVCLLFGSEGPGLTDEAVAACTYLVSIAQYGSTRSINAGAAAAIAMYAWAHRRAHTR